MARKPLLNPGRMTPEEYAKSQHDYSPMPTEIDKARRSFVEPTPQAPNYDEPQDDDAWGDRED